MHAILRQRIPYISAFIAAVALAPQIYAATLYVDPALSDDCIAKYDPVKRNCRDGAHAAYQTLAGATAVARAGDTVLIRAGTYNEPLIPRSSGIAGQPVTYRNFTDETAMLTGANLSPAIDISNREYIVIEGLHVTQVGRWLHAKKSRYNMIRRNSFTRALDRRAGGKAGLFFAEAEFNKILDNTLENNPADSLSLIDSNRNLVQGNTFRRAHHALWDIRCGDYNVLRKNYFHNDREKIGEIYDCDGQAGYVDYNATKRNVVEHNEFAYTPTSGNSAPYSGIQFAGQDSIVRFNRFYGTVGPSLQMTLYGREARYNTGNRIYHNVFHGSDYAGVEIARGLALSDNIFKNNVLAKSVFVANDRRWPWWNTTVAGKPTQIKTSRLDGFVFDTNCLFNTGAGETWLITYGWRDAEWSQQRDVRWWERTYPKLIKNSLEANPQFVDAAAHDFRPRPGSPLIDAGTFLTRTARAGEGTAMPVDDVQYFYDGYGIPDETGDRIQLAHGTQTAVVLSIDYKEKILHLDRPLKWSPKQGVHLAYTNTAPDIGAYESDTPPSAPLVRPPGGLPTTQ